MKRQIIAVAIGSLFALPAFADGEIGYDLRTVTPAQSSKTPAQVQSELVAAQRAGDVVVDGEIGTLAKQNVSMASGKSRADVRAEVVQAYRSGYFNIDGELGSATNQL